MSGGRRVQIVVAVSLLLLVAGGIALLVLNPPGRKPDPVAPEVASKPAEEAATPPPVPPSATEPRKEPAPTRPTETAAAPTSTKTAEPAKADVSAAAKVDPRPPDDGKRRVWSIVIGIDAYGDTNGIPLGRGGEFSAVSFSRWLRDRAGWPEGNTLLLVDRGEKTPGAVGDVSKPLAPTLANLKWAFEQWLPARIRPDDLVVVYFAGQMVTIAPAPGSVLGAADRGMLLAIDSRASSADLTGFSLESAIEDIAKTGKNKIVCFLDTSPKGRGKAVETTLAPAKPSAVGYARTLTRWPGVSVWLASGDRVSSVPNAAGELGPFSKVLIESFGTREEPYNLLDSLSRMRRDPLTRNEGFVSSGSLESDLTLWSSSLRLPPPRPAEMIIQRGHAQSVNELYFQADGEILATGAADSTVRVWRTSDRTLLRVLDRHLHGITALALADSGEFIASGDAKGNVQIWDVNNHRFLLREALPAHEVMVIRLAFLPESDSLVSWDSAGTVWLTAVAGIAPGTRKVGLNTKAAAVASAAGPISFAVLGQDGKLQRYGRDGSPRPNPIDAPPGRIDSERMATDGRRLVVGDRSGNLLLWDETTGHVLERRKLADPIDRVALRGDRVVIASGPKVQVFDLVKDKLEGRVSQTMTGDVTNLALSTAGDLLAARAEDGTFAAWRLGGTPFAAPIRLDGDSGVVSSVSIAPDGRTLAAGNQDGGVRFWDLASGEQKSPVPSRRGQIDSLSVSSDGRYLLQVNHDRVAQLWDLVDSRELVVIPAPETPGVVVTEGWSSGLVTADGKHLVLTTYPTGDVVVLERENARVRDARRPVPFARPIDPDDETPFKGIFRNLTIWEGNGRKLLAASAGTTACVWDFLTGSLLYTIRGHDDAVGIVRAIDFSPDGKLLATGGEDGTLQVWDLARENPKQPTQPNRTALFNLPKENNHVTACRFLPTAAGSPVRIVSGAREGDILLWEIGKKEPAYRYVPNGPAVTNLVVTTDRSFLTASFRDKSLRHWKIGAVNQALGAISPVPNHDEEVKALVAWPGRPIVASGSDDTTIRFWDLSAQKLVATLSAGEGPSDWIAFVPNGRFDCAVGAERQLTWMRNNEILPIEQFGENLRIQGLTSLLMKGEAIPDPVVAKIDRPRLAIDPPPFAKAEAETLTLTVALGGRDFQDLRLYQDGIPVRDQSEFRLAADGRTASIDVRLHNGVNRFHAMAARAGAIDGRSNDVEIRYDRPDPPGELHILALGVGNYEKENRKLKYAKKDAEEFAAFLKSRGLHGDQGITVVLRDGDVNMRNIQEQLVKLRNRVRNRPRDTVAVFLAGHTDVVADKFSLLRIDYPFPERGQIERTSIIPFELIYQYVAYLGCQQRLMIVDACRSGEILRDKGVEVVRREIDSDAHRGRTSYILAAARAGSLAGESDALEHGLLTYSLLRGMGATGLKPVDFTDVFEKNKSADRDGNKVIDAEELSWYADLTVPKLASTAPLLVQRSGVSRETPRTKPAANDAKIPVPPTPAKIPLVPLP